MIDRYLNQDSLESVAITLDTDWAPDFVLEATVDLLRAQGVAATLFASNPSAALEQSGFEIGLHPNFAPGSTHGANVPEVLARLGAWFPSARGVRTHGLYQSSGILDAIARAGLAYDSSLILYDVPHARPFVTPAGLVRIPYVWGDASSLSRSRAHPPDLDTPGLKVLNFHPMLLYLNAEHPDRYTAAKSRARDLTTLTRADLDPLIFTGRGVRTSFVELCMLLGARGVRTYTLGELAEQTRSSSSSVNAG